MTEQRPGSRRRTPTSNKQSDEHDLDEPERLRLAASRQPVKFQSGRGVAGDRPKSGAASEADGVDDMREFIGHTAWKAAPSAHVEVDPATDLLTVSCYADIPDIEIDPSPQLSVAFHLYRDECLLTSLCLYGVSRWPHPAAAPWPTELEVARGLLGESVSGAVTALLGGGNGAVELPADEATELLQHWRTFVHGVPAARRPPSP